MSSNNFPKGSEWRKWDMHIHTPCSIVQEYGGNQPEVWEKFIADLEALPDEFKVIGINDYIFLDGYKKVLEFREKGRLKNIDLILPVIELRLDKFASLGSDDPWKKVNFHIIFSNELSADIIDTHFLKAVQHCIKIDNHEGEDDFKEIVTVQTLETLGKKIKETSTKQINESDLFVGFANLTYNFDEIFKILQATTFKDKYLTAVGKSEWDTLRWDGSAASKKKVINKADFVFTALEKSDTYQHQKNKLTEQKVNDKLLDCSDAHKFSDAEKAERRLGNCFTWLKANPTFEGLKQVSKENTRIFIGDTPPLLTRVKEHPQRYIKKLVYEKLEKPILNESWFENVELELNPGLVAIIGNKGNGKSALTDTLGLLGDTLNHDNFSFLNFKKFKSPKPNRSESFRATLYWVSNLHNQTKLLNEIPHPQAIETVKYLPQGYLETLCNENHKDFLDELRNVIFNYIPEPERLGKTNLLDLEKFTSDSIQNEIQQITVELKEANKKIVELERKDTITYKEQTQSNLEKKQTDLAAHQQTKPVAIEPLNDPTTTEKTKLVSADIAEKKNRVAELENAITDNSQKQSAILLSKANLERVLSSLTLLENEYTKTKDEITTTLSSNGINVDDVIKLAIKRDAIKSKLSELAAQLEALNKLINPNEPEGLPAKVIELKKNLIDLQNTLDEPSRLYQKYLNDLQQWTKTDKEIVGEPQIFGTLKYFESELNYLNTKLSEDLSNAKAKRKEVLKKLFGKKLEILNSFRVFYQPITDFFSQNGDILKEYEIKLDVENKLTGFEEKFLSQINAGLKGSFYGADDGRRKLLEIIFNNKWETETDIIAFLDAITDHLDFDKRPNFNNEKREVDKQLKSGYSVEELYNFLFGLEYLEPTYKLKLNDKNIEGLSPGERGALLLIFYLALDRNDMPLIIDQPEENLDNQSVYNLLAQFIKNAKEKRQVIIVTHNPNLAVVCDADQIVHVSIQKHNNNKVILNSGALENPEINKAVVDILEGTYAAFDTRDFKYKVIPRKN